MTLLDLFDAALADRAAAVAYGDISYRELHAGAARVARKLREAGLDEGERISLYTENRIGFVYAYLAALRLGAIVIPTNVLYRAGELEFILGNAQARFALVSEQTKPNVAGLREPPKLIDAGDVERWAIDASIEPLAEFPRRSPGDTAVIIYTSGTTGRPKGAMLTHDNLATICSQLIASWRWRSHDVLLIALPLFHLHGLAAALNTTLAVGGRIVVHERFDAKLILAALRGGEITMFFGVPTMYVRLLEQADAAAIPQLRLYVSGSAALSAETHVAFEQRFGAQILERYGATEFGFPLSNRYGGPRVPGAVGVPVPGAAVRIVDPASSATLADGEIGELLVRGPNVFKGYWGNPEATAAAFFVDDAGLQWYRSGDLAQYDAENDVYRIVGRIKELIITGGFNVYPREVEDELERYPGVRAAAVVGAPDPARGELPVAFVEVDAGFDTEACQATLRERLASFKIPKEIHVIDVLPRNAMGKIEKPRLRELIRG
ncbi:MAG: AMP-binding protein [Candidatus Eremiobacteraeota bacterium]|nr:AMP-binding protein [Candidatus Eremiobacteraeota bacterium]